MDVLDGREGYGGGSWERGRGKWDQLKFIVCISLYVIRDTFVKNKSIYRFNNVSLCNKVSLSQPLRHLQVKPGVGWGGGYGGGGC